MVLVWRCKACIIGFLIFLCFSFPISLVIEGRRYTQNEARAKNYRRAGSLEDIPLWDLIIYTSYIYIGELGLLGVFFC